MNEDDSKTAHAARDATDDEYEFIHCGDGPIYWVTPLARIDAEGEPCFEQCLGRVYVDVEEAKKVADKAHADPKDGAAYFVFEMATTVGPMETLLGAVTGSKVVVSYREVYRTEGGPICHTLTAVF